MKLELPSDPLEASPADSTWGRNAQRVYLGVAAVAFALTLFEMQQGKSNVGTIALSVLTAPWSGLLAPLARALYGKVPDGALRIIGAVLALLCALLNSAVIRGIAARAQRDVKAPRG